MRVRLYWLDGRVEELKREVEDDTTLIIREGPQGHHHFLAVEEIDDEGFAIFWEEDSAETTVQ